MVIIRCECLRQSRHARHRRRRDTAGGVWSRYCYHAGVTGYISNTYTHYQFGQLVMLAIRPVVTYAMVTNYITPLPLNAGQSGSHRLVNTAAKAKSRARHIERRYAITRQRRMSLQWSSVYGMALINATHHWHAEYYHIVVWRIRSITNYSAWPSRRWHCYHYDEIHVNIRNGYNGVGHHRHTLLVGIAMRVTLSAIVS